MRKSILVFLSLCFAVFTLSNFSSRSSAHFIFSSLGEEPVLPEVMYNYEDVEMPEHLFDAPPSGYEPFGVNKFAFSQVTDAGATLGRVLFYDKKLSALENISCGSCHLQAKSFADDKAFSEGANTDTKRNSMHLNDMAWSNNERFFWDMSESDLNEMIRLPLTDENEIGANMDDVIVKLSEKKYYQDLFTDAFGTPNISEDKIVFALIEFIKSMNTFNSEFDKAAENNFEDLTEAELRGQELFGNNCSSCHSQGEHNIEEILNTIDNGFFFDVSLPTLQVFPNIFNNGLQTDEDDLGAGAWNNQRNHLFKIPTLRNIELTGPYMHDGQFETLEEVLDHYSSDFKANEWSIGLIPNDGFDFSDQDKSDIISFLKLFTDMSFTTNPKWSDPFDLVGNSELNEAFGFVIKPNPMSTYATIEFDNNKRNDAHISVFDSKGKKVLAETISSQTYQIQKADFLPGIYFIEILIGDSKQTQKLIVN